MMRSPKYFSVACRAPNGEIIVQAEALEKTWIGRQKWLKWPFFRGSLALLDSMALGVKAMRFAANVQTDPMYQAPVDGADVVVNASGGRIQDVVIGGTIVVSLVLGIAVFNVLPNAVAETIGRLLHDTNGRHLNYIAEFVKAILFFGYIYAIGFVPDIREVFKYHGAEHKAINTLEAERPLIIEECRKQTRLHPRCGTSFAIIVLILGFCFLPLFPRYWVTGHHQGFAITDVLFRVLTELCILPFIAGAAYELIRFAGKFRNTAFVNVMFKPGLWSQYLTTREPDERQIEVALVALRACVEREEADQSAEPDSNALESAPPAPVIH